MEVGDNSPPKSVPRSVKEALGEALSESSIVAIEEDGVRESSQSAYLRPPDIRLGVYR